MQTAQATCTKPGFVKHLLVSDVLLILSDVVTLLWKRTSENAAAKGGL